MRRGHSGLGSTYALISRSDDAPIFCFIQCENGIPLNSPGSRRVDARLTIALHRSCHCPAHHVVARGCEEQVPFWSRMGCGESGRPVASLYSFTLPVFVSTCDVCRSAREQICPLCRHQAVLARLGLANFLDLGGLRIERPER